MLFYTWTTTVSYLDKSLHRKVIFWSNSDSIRWFIFLFIYRDRFAGLNIATYGWLWFKLPLLALHLKIDATNIWTITMTHNECEGVSNHQLLDCLLNHLFKRITNRSSTHRVTGLCEGNPPVTGGFPHKGPVTRKCFRLMTSTCSSTINKPIGSPPQELSGTLYLLRL